MTRYYSRKTPGWTENLKAGLVAGGISAAVAAVTFYLVRLTLSREPLVPKALPSADPGTAGLGELEDPASGVPTLPEGEEEA
jgi:hypothetical protein